MNSGKLAFVPENELCEACRLVHSGLAKVGETRKEGNGTVTISKLVDRKDSDFRKLDEIATFFAREYGAEVILTPKMSRPHKFQYECVYSSLIGTKYEGKCPDLCINGIWYEHEGFTSANPKNAFRNMLNDGLKQSDRIVIDKPQLNERYMRHSIERRIRDGQNIKEIWTREPGGNIRLLYKKRTADQWSAPAGEESVVISYGILDAKVQKKTLIARKCRKKIKKMWKIVGKAVFFCDEIGWKRMSLGVEEPGVEEGQEAVFKSDHR